MRSSQRKQERESGVESQAEHSHDFLTKDRLFFFLHPLFLSFSPFLFVTKLDKFLKGRIFFIKSSTVHNCPDISHIFCPCDTDKAVPSLSGCLCKIMFQFEIIIFKYISTGLLVCLWKYCDNCNLKI